MTYKELIELVNLIKLNLGDQTTKGQKKLFKIYEKVKHHIDEYQSQIDEIRLDNASVDDKNNVILDDKGNYIMQYNPLEYEARWKAEGIDLTR